MRPNKAAPALHWDSHNLRDLAQAVSAVTENLALGENCGLSEQFSIEETGIGSRHSHRPRPGTLFPYAIQPCNTRWPLASAVTVNINRTGRPVQCGSAFRSDTRPRDEIARKPFIRLYPFASLLDSMSTMICLDIMRTTIRLNDVLFERAKREAERRRITLTALLEEGLQLALAQSAQPASHSRISLPVSSAAGGTMPGIDLNDTSSLLDAMEGRT